MVLNDDGTPDFHALRGYRRGQEAILVAFDLIERDGNDLRALPLIARKQRLARLLGRAKRRAIRFSEHLTGDGLAIFKHVGRMGLEGMCQSGRMSLSQRAIEDVAQVEEPGERGGALGERGGVVEAPVMIPEATCGELSSLI